MLSLTALSFRKPRRLFVLCQKHVHIVRCSNVNILTSKAVGVHRTPHCHILPEFQNLKTKIEIENEFIYLLYIRR